MKAVIYEKSTGSITRVTSCHISFAYMQKGEGEDFLVENDDADVSDVTHYVDVVEQRVLAKAPVDLNLSTLTPAAGEVVTGVMPSPGFVMVTGDQTSDVFYDEDGALEVQFDHPGEYRLSFEMPRHVAEEVIIHVS